MQDLKVQLVALVRRVDRVQLVPKALLEFKELKVLRVALVRRVDKVRLALKAL